MVCIKQYYFGGEYNLILFSIVIPCFNHAQFLGESLQSVLDQTYQNWEVIVVDDASTIDDVYKVVYGFSDPRIRFLKHKTNRGLGATRNTGIKHSNGDLILPLDADDKLSPQYLEKVYDLLSSYSHYDCVFTDFFTFGAYEKIVKYQVRDITTLLSKQCIPGAGTTFRKSLWDKVGGYCEADELRVGNEDWDFYLGAAENGFCSAHISEPLYYYRKHKESMVTRLVYTDHKTRIFMYWRHKQLFDKYNQGMMFVADGYSNSISTSLQRKEYVRVVKLLLETGRFSSHDPLGIITLLLNNVIKNSITKFYGHVYRFGRNLKRRI